MKKGGQFYFIATIVVIGIMISLAATYNSARTKKETTILLLPDEIHFEAGKVVDNAAFNDLSTAEIDSNIQNITDYYASSNSDTFFLVIYGDESSLTFLNYNNPPDDTIQINYPSPNPFYTTDPTESKEIHSAIRSSNQAEIILEDGTSVPITLRPERTLFVLAKKEKDGERFIKTSGS